MVGIADILRQVPVLDGLVQTGERSMATATSGKNAKLEIILTLLPYGVRNSILSLG
jgi:hypothetical protein